MNFSVEAECGYILTETKDGGNFSGVCQGIDLAVRFLVKEKVTTYPKKITYIFWDFILDKNKTPGCVTTCQADIQNIIIKRREN